MTHIYLPPARDFSAAAKRPREDETPMVSTAERDSDLTEIVQAMVGQPTNQFAEGFVVDTSDATFESNDTKETHV